ncbi:co-chaperone GroES [Thalassotalea sp. G20_0]|uniref:co-chaperone GroES n=1 Tax=Thalassotalea sp. G20_0 TaxID=2821093 RepID=UPI001ADAB3EF|nr:co-chaperone GroES [Thalassotalea sp. G20_0]MBO9493868.1 co-chaperone GroES [Thalassotalea sp. G20_0]
MIRAVGDFVLVKRDENPEQSEGGIHLIKTDEPATGIGRVLSVGHLVDDVAIDDQVVFPRYAGTEIRISQECFLVLRATEILATLGA